MNIASALIKQILVLRDFETWSAVRKHYLPAEYHTLFDIIEKHCQQFRELPSFGDLKFEIRDLNTQEKLCAVESIDIDSDPAMLLEYLKNEFTQQEVLKKLDAYVDHSVAFENAEESLSHLTQIVIDIEDKVDTSDPQESMQRITLFESEEEYGKYLTLGINKDFDLQHQFSPRDLILVGGFRGAGKSLTCDNIAISMFDRGKTSITYSTEMDPRAVFRRRCSIATGIDATRLRFRNLSITEWEKVATWWASRFLDSAEILKNYKEHRDFGDFHSRLTSSCELLPTQQLDVVYDPNLTISKINADLDKKLNGGMDIGIIIVDYLNKVKLTATPSRRGAFDWVEQVEIAAALKRIAATFERPVFAPFQTKEDGTVSFSKNMINEADAAYTLNAYTKADECITFKCIKMRDGNEIDFTSVMDWSSLKMGPESALTPEERAEEEESSKTGESINDL